MKMAPTSGELAGAGSEGGANNITNFLRFANLNPALSAFFDLSYHSLFQRSQG